MKKKDPANRRIGKKKYLQEKAQRQMTAKILRTPTVNPPSNKLWYYSRSVFESAVFADQTIIDEIVCTKLYYDECPKGVKMFIDSRKNGVWKVDSGEDMPKDIKNEINQGIAFTINDTLLKGLHEIIDNETLLDNGVVILDHILDPQNFGALVRSCVAFNIGAVIIHKHNQAPLSPLAARSSVGSIFNVPIISVPNISHAISELKKKRFFVYGLAGEATETLSKTDMSGRMVFIFGNEGEGLRDLIKKECDTLIKIEQTDNVESLNVSVSAGVVLYAHFKSKMILI